jgi:chloramphenicol 3-O phosphotransferase
VLQIAVRTLLPFHVLFVGVRCSLEIAEQRERERGDRIEGLARFQYPLVHSHGTYDFEVDTSTSSPTVCANQIKQFLQDGSAPKAFHILQDTFARE